MQTRWNLRRTDVRNITNDYEPETTPFPIEVLLIGDGLEVVVILAVVVLTIRKS